MWKSARYRKGELPRPSSRLSEAQQGPAGQPHRRVFDGVFDFELKAPRAPQNSFLQAVTSENWFDAFSEVEFGMSDVKTMSKLQAAAVCQEPSEASLVQLSRCLVS